MTWRNGKSNLAYVCNVRGWVVEVVMTRMSDAPLLPARFGFSPVTSRARISKIRSIALLNRDFVTVFIRGIILHGMD